MRRRTDPAAHILFSAGPFKCAGASRRFRPFRSSYPCPPLWAWARDDYLEITKAFGFYAHYKCGSVRCSFGKGVLRDKVFAQKRLTNGEARGVILPCTVLPDAMLKIMFCICSLIVHLHLNRSCPPGLRHIRKVRPLTAFSRRSFLYNPRIPKRSCR